MAEYTLRPGDEFDIRQVFDGSKKPMAVLAYRPDSMVGIRIGVYAKRRFEPDKARLPGCPVLYGASRDSFSRWSEAKARIVDWVSGHGIREIAATGAPAKRRASR